MDAAATQVNQVTRATLLAMRDAEVVTPKAGSARDAS